MLGAQQMNHVSTEDKPQYHCIMQGLFNHSVTEQKCSLQKLFSAPVDKSLCVPVSFYLPSLHATCSLVALSSSTLLIPPP